MGSLEVKGWKNVYHGNSNQKKVGVAILISNTVDFKAKKINRHKKGHFK